MRTIFTLLLFTCLLAASAIFFPYFKTSVELSLARKGGVIYVLPSTNPEDSNLPETTRTKEIQLPKTDFWLAIPRLGIAVSVEKNVDFEDKSRKVAQNKLIHSLASSLPGAPGTVVLSAHELFHANWPGTNPYFYFLKNLESGDELTIGFESSRFTYKVSSINTVESYPDIPTGTEDQKLVLLAGAPFLAGPRIQVNADLATKE